MQAHQGRRCEWTRYFGLLALCGACGGGGGGDGGPSQISVGATAASTLGGSTTAAMSSGEGPTESGSEGAGSTGAGMSTADVTSATMTTTTTTVTTTATTGMVATDAMTTATTETAGSSGGEGTTGEPSEYFMFTDPLVGGTMGTPVGGSFGDLGWTVTGKADRVYWQLPRLVEGSVEFTLSNVTLDNLPLNDHEVFAMYEGGHGIEHPIAYNPQFRNNTFKSMIRIYGTAEVGREGQQKIMWGMCPYGDQGYHDGVCPCAVGFFDEPFGGSGEWDGSPQTLRIAWADGVTRYFRNGTEVMVIDWSTSGLSFGPQDLYISLGDPRPEAVDTAGMPIGAVFSNLVVEGWTGPETATCK